MFQSDYNVLLHLTYSKEMAANKFTGPHIFFISEVKYSLIYQNVTTDSAPLELVPFNPRGLYETDANILSYLGNRNGDWRSRGWGGGRYERRLLRSDRMTAPKMSICQWEMKRRPVGFSYRRAGRPVWKISSKSFSVGIINSWKEDFFPLLFVLYKRRVPAELNHPKRNEIT